MNVEVTHPERPVVLAPPGVAPGPAVPEEPLLVIEPGRGWLTLNLRDLWRFRELLFFLTWRDVKIRYKQTALGATWAILQPLATMVLFTMIFGRLAVDWPGVDVPYPLFAFAGLLPWLFFANAVASSGNSLVGNANLITKVWFPRMMIPLAAVSAGLIDFAVAFVVLAGLMIWYQVALGWEALLLPLLVVLTALMAVGVGMWLSALNVKYRDVRHTVPFLLQLWMFASPVFYPPELLSGHWRWLLDLNPLTGIITGYRAALFGGPLDGASLGVAAGLTLLVLVTGIFNFRRMEREFADVV
jgi:lipopolysaccharide transport system permease protein